MNARISQEQFDELINNLDQNKIFHLGDGADGYHVDDDATDTVVGAMSDDQFTIFCQYLAVNTSLLTLQFDQALNAKQTEFLATALAANKTLQYLNLSNNGQVTLSNDVIAIIVDALKENNSLLELNLCGNPMDLTACYYLAYLIKHNKTLKAIYLGECNINDSVRLIAKALKHNQSLSTVMIGINNLGLLGIKYLNEALNNNHTLSTYGFDTLGDINNGLGINIYNDLGLEDNEISRNLLAEIQRKLEINIKINQAFSEYKAENQTFIQLYFNLHKLIKEKDPSATLSFPDLSLITAEKLSHLSYVDNDNLNILYANGEPIRKFNINQTIPEALWHYLNYHPEADSNNHAANGHDNQSHNNTIIEYSESAIPAIKRSRKETAYSLSNPVEHKVKAFLNSCFFSDKITLSRSPVSNTNNAENSGETEANNNKQWRLTP